MWTDWAEANRAVLRVLAAGIPLLVCSVFFAMRGLVSPSEGALLLVLLVVAAAATGDRLCGFLAGVAGAVGFDFFLTEPYLDFHIANREDIELAAVLLIVGLAVGELALWGGRQRAVASDRAGYIDGVLAIGDLAAAGAPQRDTADAVSRHMHRVLGVENVDYVADPPDPDSAILTRDGSLIVGELTLDVSRDGLPTDRFTAVPVAKADGSVGHFRITTATSVVKVSAEQLRVVVLLADQFTASERNPRRTAGYG